MACAVKGEFFVETVSIESMKTKKEFDYWINLCLKFNKKAKVAKKKKK